MSAILGHAPPPRLDRLVRDIETAILSGDRQRQSDLLTRSADLLTRRWSRLAPPDKPGFDTLLAGLLDQVDERARATFARHLTPLRRAPRQAATRLARDPSAAVALSLLENCPSFDEAWLLDLLESLGEGHRRAIARRRAVGAALCEALVGRGEAEVEATLLGNPGADLPAALVSALVPKAERCAPIALALAGRRDLTEADRATLVRFAHAAALAGLRADHGDDGDGDGAEALLEGVARTFAAPVPPDRAACHAGAAVIAGRAGGFGAAPAATARLAQWVALRRLEDVVAVLARDAGLPVGVLIACTEGEDARALALILRGLGHPWSLLKALLRHPRRPEPSPDTMAALHSLHAETTGTTARRIARYAAVRIGLPAFVAPHEGDGGHGAAAGAPVPPTAHRGSRDGGPPHA
jgi:uncharacterized protein (DUF2336 family)